MKRTSGLVFLIMAAILCLTGCRHDTVEDKTPAKYEGYWESVKVVTGGTVYEDYYLDPQIPISAVYSLAVADDGTGYLDSPMAKLYGEENKQAFNWKEEDGLMKLYGESDTDILTLEYTDRQLVMKPGNDTEIWFGKVENLSEFNPAAVTAETEGETK